MASTTTGPGVQEVPDGLSARSVIRVEATVRASTVPAGPSTTTAVPVGGREDCARPAPRKRRRPPPARRRPADGARPPPVPRPAEAGRHHRRAGRHPEGGDPVQVVPPSGRPQDPHPEPRAGGHQGHQGHRAAVAVSRSTVVGPETRPAGGPMSRQPVGPAVNNPDHPAGAGTSRRPPSPRRPPAHPGQGAELATPAPPGWPQPAPGTETRQPERPRRWPAPFPRPN